MKIKGINLVPDDIKRGWRARRIRTALAAAGCVYLALLLAFFLVERSGLKRKLREVSEAAAERDSLVTGSLVYKDLTQKLNTTRQKEAELRKMLAAASGLAEKRISWSTILKRLSRDMPENVWLRGLSTSDLEDGGGKRVRFAGSSTSNRGVAAFVFVLENAGYFHDVTLSYSQKKELESATVYEFEIFAGLKLTAEAAHEG